MHRGYIKVWRKLQQSFFYKDSHYVHLWIHLLFKANHEPNEFMLNGKKMICNRGQIITGRNVLSKETGIDTNKVFRILKTLKSEQLIEQQSLSKFSLITVLKYEDYQSNNEHQSEQPVNSQRTASEQPVNTNKNVEELKELKEVNKVVPSGTPASIRVFKRPEPQQVIDYCKEIGANINPDQWYAHYEANGWKVGRNPMKDWKAAVRTWKHRETASTPAKPQTKRRTMKYEDQSGVMYERGTVIGGVEIV